jgi:ABC-type transporter Mla MlaB component
MAPRVAFAIRGPIAEADLPGLCARVCDLLGQTTEGIVTCDVVDLVPDAVTVGALARLQLTATRRSCRIQLHNASPELRDLVAFMGLEDVLV